MANETMTNNEVAGALVQLTALTKQGCKTGEFSKMVARTTIWARGVTEEAKEAVKTLQEGHAKLDEFGDKVKPRVKNPETEAWEDGTGFLFEDPEAYMEEVEKIGKGLVNLSGKRFKDSDFKAGLKNYPPDPEVYVGLGKLFDWEDEDIDQNEDHS